MQLPPKAFPLAETPVLGNHHPIQGTADQDAAQRIGERKQGQAEIIRHSNGLIHGIFICRMPVLAVRVSAIWIRYGCTCSSAAHFLLAPVKALAAPSPI